jgi:hypothetical protein
MGVGNYTERNVEEVARSMTGWTIQNAYYDSTTKSVVGEYLPKRVGEYVFRSAGNYGHDFGDEVLRKIAKIILTNIKKDDTFCRIGGEEFVLITDTLATKEDLVKFSNKLRTLVEDFDFDLGYLYGRSRRYFIFLGNSILDFFTD